LEKKNGSLDNLEVSMSFEVARASICVSSSLQIVRLQVTVDLLSFHARTTNYHHVFVVERRHDRWKNHHPPKPWNCTVLYRAFRRTCRLTFNKSINVIPKNVQMKFHCVCYSIHVSLPCAPTHTFTLLLPILDFIDCSTRNPLRQHGGSTRGCRRS
jgi:hypothetical protein